MYKRFEIRRKAQIPIEVVTNFCDTPVKFISFDLSPRGTYLISDFLPDIGEHIVCSFNLNRDDGEFCFFGEVNRINWLRRKTDNGRPGFGVQFMDTTPLSRLKMRAALRGLPPPVPAKMRDGVIISKIISV